MLVYAKTSNIYIIVYKLFELKRLIVYISYA